MAASVMAPTAMPALSFAYRRLRLFAMRVTSGSASADTPERVRVSVV
jgi:hypothetical protein